VPGEHIGHSDLRVGVPAGPLPEIAPDTNSRNSDTNSRNSDTNSRNLEIAPDTNSRKLRPWYVYYSRLSMRLRTFDKIAPATLPSEEKKGNQSLSHGTKNSYPKKNENRTSHSPMRTRECKTPIALVPSSRSSQK
jgi:hypothetical protein